MGSNAGGPRRRPPSNAALPPRSNAALAPSPSNAGSRRRPPSKPSFPSNPGSGGGRQATGRPTEQRRLRRRPPRNGPPSPSSACSGGGRQATGSPRRATPAPDETSKQRAALVGQRRFRRRPPNNGPPQATPAPQQRPVLEEAAKQRSALAEQQRRRPPSSGPPLPSNAGSRGGRQATCRSCRATPAPAAGGTFISAMR